MPPLGMDELFGGDSKAQEDVWESLPSNLLNVPEQNNAGGLQKKVSFMEEHDKLMDDFDPLAELMQSHENKNKDVDQNQRRTIWKMNYKMKNEKDQREEKMNLIDNTLLPAINDIIVNNAVEINKHQVNDAI